MNCVDKGRRGEDLAAAFLLENEYRIVVRNWRTKSGEIDIVAIDGVTLVFCEVKSRSSTLCGSGAEAVNYRKQQKIVQTASFYLQRFRLNHCCCRFDVIEIKNLDRQEPEINHIKNAFGG